ncbi:nitroreductase family protein [bacterium]|nr:nitroreductase family protein [bacterium]
MTNLNLKIDENKCIHCGQCISDCMVGALEFGENNIPQVAQGGENRCMKCQHCLAVCPTGALSILNRSPENSEPMKEHNPEDILNLIKNRRSFRHYKKENLSPEIMNKLKDMLNWVPTGVNNHRLHFSIIDDIEVMNDVREYTNNKIIELVSKPIADTLSKKFERYKKAILKGNDIIFRGAPHMIVVSSPIDAPCRDVDPMIALSYFELYAQSLGVATCWCGLGYNALSFFPELCKQFEIPDGYKLSYTMLFGPADIKYARAVQPEPFKIVSVKKGGRKISVIERIKRVFWNSVR